MYKFTAKENIPLDTSIPEAPSIIIPSDVPIYPATGLYPSVEPINPARPVPSILGPSHAPDIPGYADAGSTWPVYSSALPVVSGYGSASQSEELTIKVLCPSNKIGRVIGKGGSSIKSIRQESGARVEVEDPKANHNECVITVISMEVVPHIFQIYLCEQYSRLGFHLLTFYYDYMTILCMCYAVPGYHESMMLCQCISYNVPDEYWVLRTRTQC